MKVIESARVDNRNGVVRLIATDGMEQSMLSLSPEAARNLIAELEEHVGVADLENEEWKADREEAEKEAQCST